MKNSKHLNVGLSITAIVCAFMLLISYEGLAALMWTTDLGRGVIPFEWSFGVTYLIFLLGGLFAIVAKIFTCSIANLKNTKVQTYGIVGLVLDCLCAIGYILVAVVFIVRAAQVEVQLDNMLVIYSLGMPLILLTSICGMYISKRCY